MSAPRRPQLPASQETGNLPSEPDEAPERPQKGVGRLVFSSVNPALASRPAVLRGTLMRMSPRMGKYGNRSSCEDFVRHTDRTGTRGAGKKRSGETSPAKNLWNVPILQPAQNLKCLGPGLYRGHKRQDMVGVFFVVDPFAERMNRHRNFFGKHTPLPILT